MNKGKVSTILGALSILPVIVSSIVFFALRGPNADVYLIIIIFGILSIIGIILAIISIFMSISSRLIRKLLFGLVGLSANVFVLFLAFLLLLAMGIGEA
ncbi:hypothetical protein [Solibacillus cecembensis]|uniref:hypothetical protein n=1 Tax=Solibacillus cecembensis TaxID=459347 RepID=UPI003CFC47F9